MKVLIDNGSPTRRLHLYREKWKRPQRRGRGYPAPLAGASAHCGLYRLRRLQRQRTLHGARRYREPGAGDRWRGCDGYVISSPVHYSGNGRLLLKCFLDRFFWAGDHALKPGAAVVSRQTLRRSRPPSSR